MSEELTALWQGEVWGLQAWCRLLGARWPFPGSSTSIWLPRRHVLTPWYHDCCWSQFWSKGQSQIHYFTVNSPQSCEECEGRRSGIPEGADKINKWNAWRVYVDRDIVGTRETVNIKPVICDSLSPSDISWTLDRLRQNIVSDLESPITSRTDHSSESQILSASEFSNLPHYPSPFLQPLPYQPDPLCRVSLARTVN